MDGWLGQQPRAKQHEGEAAAVSTTDGQLPSSLIQFSHFPNSLRGCPSPSLPPCCPALPPLTSLPTSVPPLPIPPPSSPPRPPFTSPHSSRMSPRPPLPGPACLPACPPPPGHFHQPLLASPSPPFSHPPPTATRAACRSTNPRYSGCVYLWHLHMMNRSVYVYQTNPSCS